MKATVYIPEDKASIYEAAKSELGDTISATFVRCLERELEAKRAQMNRIVVEVTDRTGRTIKKAFEGRWLIEDEEHCFTKAEEERWGFQGRARGLMYSVAQTKAGRVVVVSGDFGHEVDGFEYYDTVEEFGNAEDGGCPRHPVSLIAAVKDCLGLDHVEELDI